MELNLQLKKLQQRHKTNTDLNAAETMDNFYSRCLLCTCIPDVNPHLHIFSDAGEQLQLADKINKHLNIQIEAELPQNVCHSCMEKLEVTHELVTSSQQARIMLLQMKQQDFDQEEILMDNCSAEDFDQSDSALHCTTEGTVEQAEEFEEVLTSEIEIEEHAIKLEPGEDPLDSLPQNSNVELLLEFEECRVVVRKLLECDFCRFYTNNKTQLANHMQTHLHPPVVHKLLECHFCSFYTKNKTQLANHMQAHLQPPKTPAVFKKRKRLAKEDRKIKMKCAQCGIRYGKAEMLAWHNENCHGTDAIVKVLKISKWKYNFQCAFCNIVCKCTYYILMHLHSQHQVSNLPFSCTICGGVKSFIVCRDLTKHQHLCNIKNKDNLNQHEKNFQALETKAVRCKMCNKNFDSEKLMKEHISNFHAMKIRRYKCLHCNEMFDYLTRLRSHCQNQHPGQKILQCEVCHDNLTYSYNGYFVHKQRNHASQQVYTCDICKKKCKTKSAYKEHIKYQHGTVACNICEKKFNTKSAYFQHKKYKHKTHNIFTCNICSATLTSPIGLKNHTKRMHSMLQEQFSCKICNATFKCKLYLQKHIRNVHTGPVFHCEHCNHSTRQRSNLVAHLQAMHLPRKKSFSCEFCGAKFKCKAHLQLHVRYSHTGQILRCHHCSYSTRRKDFLIKHQKSMHSLL